jgi:hypothetical protein
MMDTQGRRRLPPADYRVNEIPIKEPIETISASKNTAKTGGVLMLGLLLATLPAMALWAGSARAAASGSGANSSVPVT